MSAQTGLAPKTAADPDPITPVIVKVGGDGGYDGSVPRTSNIVSIDSFTMPFAETVPGPTWASSLSTLRGRIRSLTVIDGPTTTNRPVDPALELASVSIKFGSASLNVMETGVASRGNVFLLITSPEVPFSVTKDGDWTTSTATFPHIENVTLMVGDKRQLFYEFQTDKVTVRLDFDLK
jgi:hypothetical protein